MLGYGILSLVCRQIVFRKPQIVFKLRNGWKCDSGWWIWQHHIRQMGVGKDRQPERPATRLAIAVVQAGVNTG